MRERERQSESLKNGHAICCSFELGHDSDHFVFQDMQSNRGWNDRNGILDPDTKKDGQGLHNRLQNCKYGYYIVSIHIIL